jgi:hypothetical protein
MDIFTACMFLLIGFALLCVIAFPERFIPEYQVKTKKVGASYWGLYQGEKEEDDEAEKTFTVKVVKKKDRVIGGATSYAMGRGVSFRGQ